MNLFKKYNTKDTLVVISLYPKKGELYSTGTSGVASYAKNVVKGMNRPVIVLADYDKRPTAYEEGNTLVLRCFKAGSVGMWEEIFQKLQLFSKVSTVMIQFDFSIYGSILNSALTIPFLGILRLMGYHTSVVNHHVVIDIRKLKGHVGLTDSFVDHVKAPLMNILFHTFYKGLGMVSDRIVVLEQPLKDKLSTIVPARKIAAIPHGVDTDLPRMSKAKARRLLKIKPNEEVVLFFGYVNWFKGADIFARTFKDTKKILGKKTRFIMAGGESATLKDKEYYQAYFKQVKKTVDASENVTLTGFVPQEDIRMYFAAADLVVFPYRHFMTASGVLSLVFSYQKPFIISSHIAEMFDAPDFKRSLRQAGLRKSDMVFDLTKKSCHDKTEAVLKNGLKAKLVELAKIVSSQRSYENTARIYEATIFTKPTYAGNSLLDLSYLFTLYRKQIRG